MNVLRLRSPLAAAGVDSIPEGTAIFAAAESLLGEDDEVKRAVLNGFLSGEGEFESIPCKLLSSIMFLMSSDTNFSDTRLLEVAQEPLRVPVAVSPAPVEEESDPQEEEHSTPAAAESTVGIGSVPVVGQSASSSFHFMQESELEAAQTPFEDGVEWVERSDAASHEAEQQTDVPPALNLEENTLVNGHIDESIPEVTTNIPSICPSV